MSLGALGPCCPCNLIVKQAAIATTWNAWTGFPLFDGEGKRTNLDADTPKYASVRTTENWKGGIAETIGGANGVTRHTDWKWYGLIGNAGWNDDLDRAIFNQIVSQWGAGQGPGCGCVTGDAPSETHFGQHYDGSQNNKCDGDSFGCLDLHRDFAIDVSDVVDWTTAKITFDAERKLLDAIDWSLIPNEWTGVGNFTAIWTDGVNPPEIPNGDIASFIGGFLGGSVGGLLPQPGLFTVDGDVASARVLCGPDPDGVYDFLYGPNGDAPHGLPSDLNPPATGVARTGHEAPSLYRGFVVRTRIETAGTFCAVEFDQISLQCGDNGVGSSYRLGPCLKGVNGPILYEPAQLALVLASFDKKYSCCL